MDKQRRKELLEEAKRVKTYMGVLCVTNKLNGKQYVAGFPNLKNKWEGQMMMLNAGRHVNAALQQEWKVLGPDAFTCETLEEQATDEVSDVRWEVKQMEKRWLDKLKPYGEQGYNRPPQ